MAALIFAALHVLARPTFADQKARIEASTRTAHMPVVQRITFARHNLVPLTELEIDLRLLEANEIFHKKSAVVCPVKFKKKNQQVVFSGAGLDQLTSEADYNAIITTPVVSGIRVKSILNVAWCNGSSQPDVIGCSTFVLGQQTSHIIVQNDGLNIWSGLDFAHEFGHNQGLPQLTDPADQRRVMFEGPDVGPDPATDVTPEECRAFKKPVAF